MTMKIPREIIQLVLENI